MNNLKERFKKYNSIENADQKNFIRAIKLQGYDDIEYVVQEKVHGANLSFITDGKNIAVAKRTEIIASDENFYGAHLVLEKYREKILRLFNDVSTVFEAQTLTIFGELFGGAYPHPHIEIDNDAQIVQRGIYYCPNNDFYAFDILINNEQYLDVEIATSIFEKYGFIFARILFKGSLEECLNHPNRFNTTIPKEFQLPELETNICEGVVIRPLKALFLKTGARVLIKNKNEEWAENNRHVDQNILKKLFHGDLSDEANMLCEEIYKLITTTRLNNLISKIGAVNPKKDLGKVLGLYNKDVLMDFLKTHQEQYEKLEKQEIKAINKFLNKHAGELIYDNLL